MTFFYTLFEVQLHGVIFLKQKKRGNFKNKGESKEEGKMAVVAKPSTRAFRLRPEKVDQFMAGNNSSFERTMKRFQAHKPKNVNGVSESSKGKNG